jgi:hypothetical protein
VDPALVLTECRLIEVGARGKLPLLESPAPSRLADAGADVAGKAAPGRTVKKGGRHEGEYVDASAFMSTFRRYLPNKLHQEHKGESEKS